MTTANVMSVCVQPSIQTPMAMAMAIGMPGMTKNHRIRDGADAIVESGCLAMTYTNTAATATHTGTYIVAKGSTPALSDAGVSVITCHKG